MKDRMSTNIKEVLEIQQLTPEDAESLGIVEIDEQTGKPLVRKDYADRLQQRAKDSKEKGT